MFRILFQLKRFYFIYYKESLLFFKKIYKNSRNSLFKKKDNIFIHKAIPNINKEIDIVLDHKTYDFYSLQPKNTEPFYANSPLFIILKKHKKAIFNNLLEILQKSYDFKVKIGLELEFYILNNAKNIDIVKELKKYLPNIENIEKEMGENQFEIKTIPTTNIKKFVEDYFKIIDILNNFANSNNLELNLEASPFENDCGSALQINFSIIDQNNKNLFARQKNEKNIMQESQLLLNCMAGLLKNINNNLLLYIKDYKCLDRFDIKKNQYIVDNNKYPAPTYISWGINNRSTCVRIPTPSNIIIENYIEEDNKNRRIEYRIPSACADLQLVLIGIFTSIIEGIDNNLIPHIDKTSFNVLLKNDNLEKIETDFEKINDIFSINEDVLFF